MSEQNRPQDQAEGKNRETSTDGPNESGDPGRTPGSAEGDEEIVDESLRQKERGTN